MNGDRPSDTPENQVTYPAQVFDFHAFSTGLAQHLAASLKLSVMAVPEILFYVELFAFPAKIGDLITRLTAGQRVPNPNSPLGRALTALSRMKELVEEAKGHIKAEEYTQAKDKISEAEALASDENIFPAPSPAPGLEAGPIANEDLRSILGEIRFMKHFAAAALGIDGD